MSGRRRVRVSARRRAHREAGAVTAELALALPTLVLVLVVGLWLQATVALQARCQDAARAGARAAARGDSDGQIGSALGAALPAGAAVRISRSGGVVRVGVGVPARLPPGLSGLVGAPQIEATAVATVERAGALSAVAAGGGSS